HTTAGRQSVDFQITLELACHMIKGPPALRAAGKVDTARHQTRLEFRCGEYIAQKMTEYRLQPGKLLRKQKRQSPPVLVRFRTEHIRQSRMKALFEHFVFGIERPLQTDSGRLQIGIGKS